MVKTEITAEEALEMSGCQSEIDLINLDISQAAEASKRHLDLSVEVMRSKWRPNIVDSLIDRGFRIEEKTNPTILRVLW